MKKKLTLLLVFALVLTMIPAPASAALKSAGSPTEVQTLVSSENLEHNFVKVTANGSTLHIEAETPVKSPEYNISVRQKGAIQAIGLDAPMLPIWVTTAHSAMIFPARSEAEA